MEEIITSGPSKANMIKIRYTSTDCFKTGDSVWVIGVSCTAVGNIKYLVRPHKCVITKVEPGYICLMSPTCTIPDKYNLDPNPELFLHFNADCSLNCNVAKTCEEAIENFNLRIKSIIDEKYEEFDKFRTKMLSLLI